MLAYLMRLFLVSSLVFSAFMAPRFSGAPRLVDPPRLLLRFTPEADPVETLHATSLPVTSQPGRLFAYYGLQLQRYLPQIQVWVVTLGESAALDALAGLKEDPRLEWVEADGLLSAAEVTPNDYWYASQQANLRLIGLPLAWSLTTGSTAWPAAVIDTGLDLDHPDLQAKVWVNSAEIPANGLDDDSNGYIDDVNGWNFVAGNNLPQDDYSHGSHVAGILGAQTNNTTGIAGVSWATPLMALKALNSSGNGNASDVAAAILYAADNGARVLNMSFGADVEYQAIHDAIVYALGKGCLLVAAAGNTGGAVQYPAAQAGVLAVSATDNNDRPASFSSRGPQIAVAAPGVNIYSANRYGSYYFGSGTSDSAPQVSGLAALVWSVHPEWNALQVTQAITSTAKDIGSVGKDSLTGWGRVNAGLAIFALYQHVYLPSILTQ